MPQNIFPNPIEEPVYSQQVNDIISQKPSWIVRNGIGLFLFIFSCIIAITYFVQYPDIVNANARLVSVNPPIELKTKTAGKLLQLNVAEKDSVQQGTIIAILESVANADKLLQLNNVLVKVKAMVDAGQTSVAIQYYEDQHKAFALGTGLGEVQEGYHNFMNAYQVFRQYLLQGFYIKKKAMLQGDLIFLQKMKQNFVQQKNLLQEDIALASKNFSANESLNKDKVVADVEYRNEKSKFIGKKMSLPQLNASIIGNESSLHEKQKEIMQLENEIAQQKMIFTEALNSYLAQLQQWQANYLITAPFAGRVAFADFILVNQFYPANQTICLVNPGRSNYYAQVFISQNNFGKVHPGQHVLLKLPSYPYREFGSIKGKLHYISQIPTDSGFAGKINLPQGLLTNQQKTLQYREGLIANAEVITENRRLIHRLFSSLYDVFERK
ncbi:MAG TPA: HlyD family efflux transporter periplasmic adaptor subunit [Ferruginibacter sp.]|nr:HlyD family efflux transporter periplasmic adaptor subunit [Ferruginibacter sp.]HRE65065.1 HlyD family efflux transporter periplasmic adaptor subunit [Ferruginibacter sp.]